LRREICSSKHVGKKNKVSSLQGDSTEWKQIRGGEESRGNAKERNKKKESALQPEDERGTSGQDFIRREGALELRSKTKKESARCLEEIKSEKLGGPI